MTQPSARLVGETTGKAEVFINGRFLAKSSSGVQRYAWELLLASDELMAQGLIDSARYQLTVLHPLTRCVFRRNASGGNTWHSWRTRGPSFRIADRADCAVGMPTLAARSALIERSA